MDPTARHELVLTPGAAITARRAGRELWAARDVVRAFAVRSLRIRYRQAALGALWAVAQPLALLVPFAAFLASDVDRPGAAPYAASALAALIGWGYLSSAVTNGAGALVNEAFLVRKTWFPREAPVLAAVLAPLVEVTLGLGLYAVAGPLLGARLGWGLVTLPLLVAALAIVAASLALPLAALNALFRDVRHALPFVVLLWLFVSPVAYPIERVTDEGRLLYAFANPAAGPLDGFRRVLAEGTWPDLTLLGASMTTALVVGTIGHRLFRRLAPTLPDLV
ncbi:MAG: ABC transporter permease [Acidimicrobiia bacterium]|nr:ABC transporter permease [Acidimicrobiia bacterium]